MKNRDTKLIRIPSRGRVISSRGYVSTPITRPYRETLENIFRMLTSVPKPTILEVLPGGRTIELNTSNFDKDNTLVKPEISPGHVIPSVNRAENNINSKEEATPDESSKEVDNPSDDNKGETEIGIFFYQKPTEEATPEVPSNDTDTEETTDTGVANEISVEEVCTENKKTKEESVEELVQEENQPQGKYPNKKNKNKNKNKQRQNTVEMTHREENVEVIPETIG